MGANGGKATRFPGSAGNPFVSLASDDYKVSIDRLSNSWEEESFYETDNREFCGDTKEGRTPKGPAQVFTGIALGALLNIHILQEARPLLGPVEIADAADEVDLIEEAVIRGRNPAGAEDGAAEHAREVRI